MNFLKNSLLVEGTARVGAGTKLRHRVRVQIIEAEKPLRSVSASKKLSAGLLLTKLIGGGFDMSYDKNRSLKLFKLLRFYNKSFSE